MCVAATRPAQGAGAQNPPLRSPVTGSTHVTARIVAPHRLSDSSREPTWPCSNHQPAMRARAGPDSPPQGPARLPERDAGLATHSLTNDTCRRNRRGLAVSSIFRRRRRQCEIQGVSIAQANHRWHPTRRLGRRVRRTPRTPPATPYPRRTDGNHSALHMTVAALTVRTRPQWRRVAPARGIRRAIAFEGLDGPEAPQCSSVGYWRNGERYVVTLYTSRFSSRNGP